MAEIKVGAEVTIVGKVDEIIADVPEGYYRIEFSGGSTVWVHKAEIASVKNPRHAEPASGYAVVDGNITWKTPNACWETDSAVYNGWSDLLDLLDPESVVELVRKDAA